MLNCVRLVWSGRPQLSGLEAQKEAGKDLYLTVSNDANRSTNAHVLPSQSEF